LYLNFTIFQKKEGLESLKLHKTDLLETFTKKYEFSIDYYNTPFQSITVQKSEKIFIEKAKEFKFKL
jgi:hypothetical protein